MYGEPDKKEYAITGKVEIGTDEYRDLIENALKLKHEAERKSDQYWAESNKNSQLKEELKAVNKELAVYKEFVNALETRKTDYLNFVYSRRAMEMDSAPSAN